MTRPDTEYEPIELLNEDIVNEQPKRRNLTRIFLFFPIILLALVGIGYWLYSEMLGYSAHSRVKTYLSEARRVYEIAQLWQEEGTSPLQSYIGQFEEDPPEGSFNEYLNQYTYNRDGWYAIKCDAEGNVLCVWYSRREITENEVRPISWRSSIEDLKNPFRFTNTVVCYPQEGGTPIDEPIY